MGSARGDTGRNVHSESESGVPGAPGARRSVHGRLQAGASPSAQRRLLTRYAGRGFTGLKLDARIWIGDRLRRVVYLRVGDGDTTGENLGTVADCITELKLMNEYLLGFS